MAQQMNLLHIICHDAGRHLGCYGRADVPSPNLDRLAGEGVRFANCFTVSPPCSPARGALMTGRYAHSNGQVGLAHRGFELPENQRTITDYLNEAGYLTANIGLQHERKDPTKNRYQHDEHESNHCEVVAEKVVAFLEQQAKQAGPPFYLNAGFSEVHLPFDRAEYTPGDPARVSVPGWLPDNEGVREELARFNGAIGLMDQAVGTILAGLERTGLSENTLVMFTTDHGMAFPRAKGMLYDPGIGVALMMRMPPGRGPQGLAVHDIISSIDIAPTLLEAAGVSIPETIQGRSFLGLLTGGAYEPRLSLFAEKNYHDSYDPIRCVRTGRLKYLRNFERRRKIVLASDQKRSSAAREMWPWVEEAREPEELYDLEADPYEMNNLAGEDDMKAVLEDLRGQLERWMEETGDPLLAGPVAAPEGARVDAPDPPVD